MEVEMDWESVGGIVEVVAMHLGVEVRHLVGEEMEEEGGEQG